LVDDELLIIASNCPVQDAAKIYGLRWEIETLFGCLKGRGFKLEEPLSWVISASKNSWCCR